MNNYILSKAMQVRSLFLRYFSYQITRTIFYLVITSVTPNSGSTVGGTTLNINGNFFDTSATYPLVVNVGGEPCTVLSSSTTNIQCQTPVQPSTIASRYQGLFYIDLKYSILK